MKATLTRPHRVIRFDQNRGIVAGLNACIADVRAPVVIRMDADDRMPPDRIERQLAYLDNHPEVDVVGASMAVFGSGLRMWTKPTSHHDICASLLWAPGLNHPTAAARTQVLQDHPYEEGHHLAEDYALWLALAQQGPRSRTTLLCGVLPDGRPEHLPKRGPSQAGALRRHAPARHPCSCPMPMPQKLTPGLTNGAHQVLAGMCALHAPNSPGLDKVKQHAEALLRALEAHGDRHPETLGFKRPTSHPHAAGEGGSQHAVAQIGGRPKLAPLAHVRLVGPAPARPLNEATLRAQRRFRLPTQTTLSKSHRPSAGP